MLCSLDRRGGVPQAAFASAVRCQRESADICHGDCLQHERVNLHPDLHQLGLREESVV